MLKGRRLLDANADQINELRRTDGTTPVTLFSVWEALKERGVKVAYETLRKWDSDHPATGEGAFRKLGPGIPKTIKPPLFKFLPDDPFTDSSPHPIPPIFMPLLKICSSDGIIRSLITQEAFAAMGIPVDASVPRQDWILPVKILAKFSDLELCLMAYFLSDLPSPPLDKNAQDFGIWLERLTAHACKLRATTLAPPDATVGETSAGIHDAI